MSYRLTTRHAGPVAGSVVKARSPFPLPDHSGIVGMPLPDGTPTVVDNTLDGVQVRTFEQFAEGRAVEYVWVPDAVEQQAAVLDRAYSQLGQGYNLFSANCEHFVTWVVIGAPESPQLRAYVVGAGLLGVALFALRSFSGRRSKSSV